MRFIKITYPYNLYIQEEVFVERIFNLKEFQTSPNNTGQAIGQYCCHHLLPLVDKCKCLSSHHQIFIITNARCQLSTNVNTCNHCRQALSIDQLQCLLFSPRNVSLLSIFQACHPPTSNTIIISWWDAHLIRRIIEEDHQSLPSSHCFPLTIIQCLSKTNI